MVHSRFILDIGFSIVTKCIFEFRDIGSSTAGTDNLRAHFPLALVLNHRLCRGLQLRVDFLVLPPLFSCRAQGCRRSRVCRPPGVGQGPCQRIFPSPGERKSGKKTIQFFPGTGDGITGGTHFNIACPFFQKIVSSHFLLRQILPGRKNSVVTR